MISVCIASRNRQKQIIPCVRSILANGDQNFEIIIIDQSSRMLSLEDFTPRELSNIRYFHVPARGKSVALNTAVRMAKGNILAFTDDDCLVDDTWLSQIRKTFTKNKQVNAVFGRTFPYTPEKHPGEHCPCIFVRSKAIEVKEPCRHDQILGFGNNMAIRSAYFDSIGDFKTWLGPGSIGSNAEDAELANRILIRGGVIRYTPSIVVYHNKWLLPELLSEQNFSYICGEMAAYGYFHFQGYSFATPVVQQGFYEMLYEFKRIAKDIAQFKWNVKLFYVFLLWARSVSYRIHGIIVGLIFSRLDPVDL